MTLPLQDITVVDLSLLLPGPYCTHLLAERGARVTAVKPPHGDLLRFLPPDGLHYEFLHSRKQLQSLDLKHPDGLQTLDTLLETADVLVEGFRPGVMARLALDYAALSKRFPRLIYCSISGYGQTGPKARKAGHDLNYLAESGLLAHFCESAGKAVLPPIPFADLVGGSLAAVAEIALALYEREKTGRGRYLDIAMSDRFSKWLLPFARAQAKRGDTPPELAFHRSPRYGIYRSHDGAYFALACLEDKFWKTFCELVGKTVWLSYPGSQTPWQEDQRLEEELAELFRSQNAPHWIALGEKHDICLSPVLGYSSSCNPT